MKKLLFLLLLVPALVQAQDFRHRYFHYDQHFYGGPFSLGADSTTDGISAAYFTDGTAKGKVFFSGNRMVIGTTTNHHLALMEEGAEEIRLKDNLFYSAVTGDVALGSTSYGWNGLYLSDGTDKWSLVPGTNLLTLAAGTSDAGDDQEFNIAAGGSASDTRGAWIRGVGNEHAAKGDLYLITGDAAGSDLVADLSASDSKFRVRDASANTLLDLEQDGDLVFGATNGGNIVMAKEGTGFRYGTLSTDISNVTGVPPLHIHDSGYWLMTLMQDSADASGAYLSFYKGRKGDGTADTKVNSGDTIGVLRFYGADGTDFEDAAQIYVKVDGSAGDSATDMPGAIYFAVSPDGSDSPAEAMRISQDKSVTIAAGIKSSATDVGWVVRAGADTACTTTCGANKGCLFGIDAGAAAVVACATATADTCLCSQ